MEQRIGTQLLARTTRSLTEAGQRYLEDCRRILAELNEAEEAAAGSYSVPCGHRRRPGAGAVWRAVCGAGAGDYLDRFPGEHQCLAGRPRGEHDRR